MGTGTGLALSMALIFRSATEARDQLHRELPSLATASWHIKSPLDTNYQCIAWAACRTDRAWWPWDHPRYYWPPGFRKFPVYSAVPVDSFAELFEKKFGYRRCQSSAFEFGYQKVVIYANALGVTHMARQHFWGLGWLSKLGDEEDILHSQLADVEGDIAPMAQQYGRVAQIMKRSWWAALIRLCLFRSCWASLKFWFYRRVIPWNLT
jgi:hypothetical protein